jgi:hypothetical protein
MVELVTFVGSIFVFVQLANMDQYLLLSNEAYWEMATMILKPELVVQLEKMLEASAVIFQNILALDMGDVLNLDTLMDAVSSTTNYSTSPVIPPCNAFNFS